MMETATENQINARIEKLAKNAPDAHDAFMFSQRLF
jgi:hypothetical protein